MLGLALAMGGLALATPALEAAKARIWDAQSGQALGAPLQHENWVLSAAFSPDGTRVVTAAPDCPVAGSIAMVGQLPAANRGDDASAAMFRPGRILQFGGNSNGAAGIDIRSGTPVVTATGQLDAVLSVHVSHSDD